MINATNPIMFREKYCRAMELLNQKPYLTFEHIGKELGVTRQMVHLINCKLGVYGRPSKQAQILKREAEEKTLTPVRQFPTRRQAPSEHNAYASAKQRCTNPKNPKYADYGGRGIKFLFINFEQFWKHIGAKPYPELELDRINNDGNYEPGNVQWTSHKDQCSVGKRRVKSKVKQINSNPIDFLVSA